MTTLTVLHPGAMGAAVAAQAAQSGHQVLWVPAHRSAATQERARKAGLTACLSLREALDASVMLYNYLVAGTEPPAKVIPVVGNLLTPADAK